MSATNAADKDKLAGWLKATFGIDVDAYPAQAGEQQAAAGPAGSTDAAPGAASDGAPGGGADGAPGGDGAKPKKPDPAKPEERFTDHQTNPFDAPEVLVEIERLALPKVQALAVQQSQNAARDFMTALAKVKAAKAAEAAAEEASRELMMTIVISIALMPLGPVIEAAAAGIAGPALRNQLGGFIADSVPTLERKFGAAGAKAADKAFNLVASEKVAELAAKFDAGKAKAILEKGQDKLKETTVKFAASSDKGKAVASYLDALQKSANDSMHNLTNIILTTTSLSEAVAFYNLFSMPLQASYEATLSQQVDDMLSEVNDVMAQHGEVKAMPSMSENSSTTYLEEIVAMEWKGRKMLAHVTQLTTIAPFTNMTMYSFRHWVTPDMQETAQRMVKETLKVEQFKNQHIPDPELEPGERVVLVPDGGKDRLMLIVVEDKHGFFSTDYGVCTFKQWAETQDDIRALTSRGAMQNGGIRKMSRNNIKSVP